jgi:methionine-S-sulfoxide reductase
MSDDENVSLETAIFASGCFWGTEYYMKRATGVVSARVGYIGGHVEQPTYGQVCRGSTGHAEAVEIVFNTIETSYERLTKLFFETHDPTQINRQGPDIGEQYRSEIFYLGRSQKTIAEELIRILRAKGLDVVTRVSAASVFWPAEEDHQDYYDIRGGAPYCHRFIQRF